MLSQTAQYALRAVLYLAARDSRDDLVKIDEIADELRMPRNSLSKTLHALGRAGVLASTRGPSGGFRLAVAPDRLTLARVVAPFDTIGQRDRQCILGRSTCSDAKPCTAHDSWKTVSQRVHGFFSDTTVADMLHDASVARLRTTR
ncbi:MAG TPA: Rrf2 family transcriptional regulator [Gemmatimonadales bacterium]